MNAAGSLQAIAMIMAPEVPIKKEPSAIMENCPEPKMMITARAVNISGAAASMIFPILRREVNGPIKKLVMAVIGSSLTSSTIRETSAQAMEDDQCQFYRIYQQIDFFITVHGTPPEFLLLSVSGYPAYRFQALPPSCWSYP